jgi:hypothetical protein
MKRLTLFAGLLFLALAVVAGAETGATVHGSAIAYPVPPKSDNDNNAIMQFNNLTIQSVSANTPPAEIIASTNVYILEKGESKPGATPAAPAVPSSIQSKCARYTDKESNSGTAITCPTPAMQAATSTSASAMVYPYRGGTYKIEVSATTHLMLRDRTAAALADFTVGDQINVFGIYNQDGSVDALIVRNISKPVEKQFVQLNNVDLVSVSATTAPATLTVVQQIANPCYGFGKEGNTKQGVIACPMGLKSFSDNSSTQSVVAPQALMPIINQSRKYVVQVDAQTIIMNRERGSLTLGDLKIGDKLNIYGATQGNGEVVDADIIRDLSQPPMAQSYSGKVTQVNSDGSFVIQTTSGETYTVQNPIQVGAAVQLKGLLDQLQKVISQVSQIMVKNGF